MVARVRPLPLRARAAPRRRSTRPCTPWSARAHVDHLHPDAVIALAAAADGEPLTKECFGREVGWVPWRRPGFELGRQIAALAPTTRPAGRRARRPRAHHLGRHVRGVPGHVARRDRTGPSGSSSSAAAPTRSARSAAGFGPLPPAERRRLAGALAPPHPRPVLDRPPHGRPGFTDSDVVLDFLAARGRHPPGAARHVVPRPLHPHEGAAAAARPAADRARGRPGRAPAGAARRLPRRLRRLLPAPRRRRLAGRCAAPIR